VQMSCDHGLGASRRQSSYLLSSIEAELAGAAYQCSSPESEDFDSRTTPWIACEPKWPLAGDPNTRVTLENGTSVPPLTQTCSIDSTVSFFEKGAGAPLPVI